MPKFFEWPRNLRGDERGIDKILGWILGIAVILLLVIVLVDIQYLAAIVAILLGAVILYVGKGNVITSVIGGIVAVVGVVLLFMVAVGGSLHL
ncbi:MAG TPA: hypothetical protein VGG32_10620 [Thermoplasmata archaeon]|jgi:hypothetical protein